MSKTKIKKEIDNYINIIYDYDKDKTYKLFNFYIKDLSYKLFAYVLSFEKLEFNCEISLFLVDKAYIKKINNRHRKINRITDVLSFPLIDLYNIKNKNRFIKNNNLLLLNQENSKINIGDVVICSSKVIQQAKKYNHSIKREFSFLFVHSILHLLGYDHINKKDEEIMFSKQKLILYNLGIVD